MPPHLPVHSCSLLHDTGPCHLATDAGVGLFLQLSLSYTGTSVLRDLLWDHLAGVNTFPTKPAWIEANVNAVLSEEMKIPGYL